MVPLVVRTAGSPTPMLSLDAARSVGSASAAAWTRIAQAATVGVKIHAAAEDVHSQGHSGAPRA